jgi:hypothetical protein
MMKTVSGLLIGLCMVVGIQQLSGGEERSINVIASLGIIKQQRIDSLVVTYGLGADIPLGKWLIFSPEIQYWSLGFFLFNKRDSDAMALGSTLNLDAGSFFWGGGFLWLPHGEISSTEILYKINAGYKAVHLKITAYILSDFEPNSDDSIWLGASIGYVF